MGDGPASTARLVPVARDTRRARYRRTVLIANRTGDNAQTADNCVRTPANRGPSHELCGTSCASRPYQLSTSQFLDQLAMHHGEKKQSITTEGGKLVINE